MDWRQQLAPNIVGEDPRLIQILDIVRRIADAPSTVLIQGETGTGKELLAKAIHNASNRRHENFVALNCAAIPDTIIESELFGHTQGAFTDARNEREGILFQADKGTLLLDEIGEMSLAMQVKLLRVLQDKIVTPVGSNYPRHIDLRLIAATNKDLSKLVSQGKFREDLFYRLNVIKLRAPTLRERPGDILVLAEYFIAKINKEAQRNVAGLDKSARQVLQNYFWPGNVRQLASVIENAVVLKGFGWLSAEDLNFVETEISQDFGDLTLKGAMDVAERVFVTRAMEKARGSKTEAASILGLNRTTLIEKLKRYA